MFLIILTLFFFLSYAPLSQSVKLRRKAEHAARARQSKTDRAAHQIARKTRPKKTKVSERPT
jgi:hypothetical protein